MTRTGVQALQAEARFDYADGTEALLYTLFRQEDFEEQRAWTTYNWWPLSYHLSPARANIISWLPAVRDGLHVLEVGAGCGAITSYLCRLPVVQRIVAVEGAPQRAELIRLRCRHASHLEVVTANIEDYSPSEPFDVILLIGVLEYAGRYIAHPDAASHLLHLLSSWLRPNGRLVVAIENPIGHKYLAGYREDHYGVPFEGVSGYPDYNGIRTFDRGLLQSKLEDAGLLHHIWFYPFPDYKMPEVVLAERSFSEPGFDWLTLLNLPTVDYSLRQRPLFNEREFLRMVARNAPPSAFMNSFLVIASRQPLPQEWTSVLAVKMRTLCAPAFRQTKFFVKEGDHITVMTARGEWMNRPAPLALHCDLTEPYHQHLKNLEHLFIDCLWHKRYAEAASALLRWYATLLARVLPEGYHDYDEQFARFCTLRLGRALYPANSQWLPPNCLDLTPRNCLLNEASGEVTVIDLEWDVGVPLPLDLVADRGMLYLVQKVSDFFGTELLNRRGEWNLPRPLLNRLPAQLRKGRVGDVFLFECWFQTAVLQGDLDYQLSEQELRAAMTTIGLSRGSWLARLLRRLGDASRSPGVLGASLRQLRRITGM
ncbi:MAG: class I SAM-dependent methyltransferase [Armatimonadota bacterium]|nr:class I SAM-dependent methyltransferase [bacterium]MDW8289103.1 class I SAM-dependent methyltransferase [Armatimonadota bacterium]